MSPETVPILTFIIGEQTYALPIADVVEVVAMVALTPSTDPRPELLGFANRHGHPLPVLDLRPMLGYESKPVDAETLFIVVRQAAHLVGLVVDEVQQVAYIPKAQNSVRGIISYKNRLVQVLALNTLLAAYDL